MKNIVFSFFLCVSLVLSIKAQVIRMFHENKNHGFVLYADNREFNPVSVLLDLNLSNLYFSEGNKKIFVVPPRSIRFKIGELKPISNNPTRFSYNFRTTLGDIAQENYDTSFIYDLPFERGRRFKMFQGYNGIFSHQNDNALDFTMPEGTEVVAARDGIIVHIVQHNTESCLREECKKFNNHVIIMHSDKTFGYYGHIRYNGAKCIVGEIVERGDVIAYSGSVGWSSGPHLHFACFLGGFDKVRTFETKFRIGNGDQEEMLKEGIEYSRNY